MLVLRMQGEKVGGVCVGAEPCRQLRNTAFAGCFLNGCYQGTGVAPCLPRLTVDKKCCRAGSRQASQLAQVYHLIRNIEDLSISTSEDP